MKYKILNNLSTKEVFTSLALIICLIVVVVVPLVAIKMYTSAINKSTIEQKKEVYLWDNESLKKIKLAENLRDPEDGSIKATLIHFHRLFWSSEPYMEFIEENHKEALKMGDNSIKVLKRFLQKEGYFKKNIAAGYHVRFIVKPTDIEIDYTSKPYKFKVNATLKTIRNNDILIKSLVSVGYIRSEFNTEGNSQTNLFDSWYIMDYSVLEFKEIKTIKQNTL